MWEKADKLALDLEICLTCLYLLDDEIGEASKNGKSEAAQAVLWVTTKEIKRVKEGIEAIRTYMKAYNL